MTPKRGHLVGAFRKTYLLLGVSLAALFAGSSEAQAQSAEREPWMTDSYLRAAELEHRSYLAKRQEILARAALYEQRIEENRSDRLINQLLNNRSKTVVTVDPLALLKHPKKPKEAVTIVSNSRSVNNRAKAEAAHVGAQTEVALINLEKSHNRNMERLEQSAKNPRTRFIALPRR